MISIVAAVFDGICFGRCCHGYVEIKFLFIRRFSKTIGLKVNYIFIYLLLLGEMAPRMSPRSKAKGNATPGNRVRQPTGLQHREKRNSLECSGAKTEDFEDNQCVVSFQSIERFISSSRKTVTPSSKPSKERGKVNDRSQNRSDQLQRTTPTFERQTGRKQYGGGSEKIDSTIFAYQYRISAICRRRPNRDICTICTHP